MLKAASSRVLGKTVICTDGILSREVIKNRRELAGFYSGVVLSINEFKTISFFCNNAELNRSSHFKWQQQSEPAEGGASSAGITHLGDLWKAEDGGLGRIWCYFRFGVSSCVPNNLPSFANLVILIKLMIYFPLWLGQINNWAKSSNFNCLNVAVLKRNLKVSN